MKPSWILTLAIGVTNATSQCKIPLAKNAGTFEADTLLYDDITMGKYWSIYFEFMLTAESANTNLLHITNGGASKRIPAIFVDGNSKLMVHSHINGDNNKVTLPSYAAALELNKWHKVKVHLTKSRSTNKQYVELDGRTWSNTWVRQFPTSENAKIYMSSRWFDAPIGSFRNLVIKTDCNLVNVAACGNGYVLNPSTNTCSDKNECTNGGHDCAAIGSICTNSVGSWSCACEENYEGDGKTCMEKIAPQSKVKGLAVDFKLQMEYSSAFEDNQSQESQQLFTVVKEAALQALGSLRSQYAVELIGFSQGSVVVETELIPTDPETANVAQLGVTIQSSQFKSSFKDELALQNTSGNLNFPEADGETVQLKSVVETTDDADMDILTSQQAEVSCNNDQNEVRMKVKVAGSVVMQDIGDVHGWTDNNDGTFGKEWQIGDFDLTDQTEYYEESGYLVLSKTAVSPCTEKVVGGVTVCTKTGHTLVFKCRYPLVEQNLAKDFSVTGSDAQDDISGVGKLQYTLSVDQTTNYLIGSTVNVDITPATAGLVFASLRDCDVTLTTTGASVSILDYDSGMGELNPVCPLSATIIQSLSATDPLQFSFAAFKWNTSTPSLIEDQNLVCTISLHLSDPADSYPNVCP